MITVAILSGLDQQKNKESIMLFSYFLCQTQST